MKFFEKQKVDEIGYLGVKLQKVLLFLCFVAALGFLDFAVITWVLSLLTLALLFTGFWGSYKRNATLLRIYVTINVVLITFMLVTVAVSMIYLSLYPPQDSNNPLDGSASDNGMPASSKLMSLYHPAAKQIRSDGTNDFKELLPVGTPESSADSNTQLTDLTKPNQNSMPTDLKPQDYTTQNIWFFLSLLVSLIIFAYKIASIVMAARMARMLREKQVLNLAHPMKRESQPAAPEPQYVYIPMNVQPFQPTPGAPSFQQQPIYYNPYLSQQQQV